jgi:hypothetical protein
MQELQPRPMAKERRRSNHETESSHHPSRKSGQGLSRAGGEVRALKGVDLSVAAGELWSSPASRQWLKPR